MPVKKIPLPRHDLTKISEEAPVVDKGEDVAPAPEPEAEVVQDPIPAAPVKAPAKKAPARKPAAKKPVARKPAAKK
jgi:hypothetical protein